MTDAPTGSIHDAVGGIEGLRRLAEAWHERVLADEVVAHAFAHGYRDDHVERLATYLAEALGGPTSYTSRYGTESDVVRLHSGNGEHTEMDERAIACWDLALEDVGIPRDGPLRGALHDYFAWATTQAMARHPDSADDVPDGLVLTRWTWDGAA